MTTLETWNAGPGTLNKGRQHKRFSGRTEPDSNEVPPSLLWGHCKNQGVRGEKQDRCEAVCQTLRCSGPLSNLATDKDKVLLVADASRVSCGGRSLVDSCTFAQHKDGMISATWGDDLIGSGYRANMEAMHSSATRVSSSVWMLIWRMWQRARRGPSGAYLMPAGSSKQTRSTNEMNADGAIIELD